MVDAAEGPPLWPILLCVTFMSREKTEYIRGVTPCVTDSSFRLMVKEASLGQHLHATHDYTNNNLDNT
jgi:hypothetical protein